MARQRRNVSSPAPWLYASIRQRLWRADDQASGTLVSFIVGAAVFLIGVTYLLNFAIHPPGANGAALDQADLKATGDRAMQLILGSSGSPSTWGASAYAVDHANQLGLLQPGSTSRVDPAKFDALAHGSSAASSDTNGYVDYLEAKTALGLAGYEFHLRSSPIINGDLASNYGVVGMEDFHVGYVGAYSSGAFTSMATSESNALDILPIDYSPSVAPTGDLYEDDSSFLRTNLVPKLGSVVTETVIANGNGNPKYDFTIVNGSSFVGLATGATSSRAMGIANGGIDAASNLGYTKGREMRAVIGTANFSGVATAAVMTWGELVDTGHDSGDYGFVELSTDGGATWHAIQSGSVGLGALSLDTSGVWTSRTVTISVANCAACLGASSVIVGYHWVADNDPTTGHGWVVDNVGISTTAFSQGFERPTYDLLLIGSDTAQNAFTPNEVKNAIGNFVNVEGGRIIVLGGEQNTQWLQPLMHVGISGSSSSVATPDTTHPLLSVPNQLDWASYGTNAKVWDFSGGADSGLFTGVVQTTAGQDILAVSNTGAFGAYGANGSVILTTYLPYTMTHDQEEKFLANALTYGKYRALYFDLGPTVPTDIPVSVVSRSATIDMSNDGSGVYTEIGLTMYVWKGAVAAGTSATLTAVPSPPRALNATPWNAAVQINWTWPVNNGTSPVTNYVLWRGTTSGTETFYRSLSASWFTFNDTNVTNGVTYYYNVSANSSRGASTSSVELSAVPSTIPTAPTALAAVNGVGLTTLSWSTPLSNGGGSLSNYTIYRGSASGTETFLTMVPSTCTTYIDVLAAGVTRYYNVSASNANGEGPRSAETSGGAYSPPSSPVASAVANSANHTIALTWAAPSSTPGITAYNIYIGNSSGATTFVTAVNSSTLAYFDGSIANGTTRYYRVSANNTAGESAPSAQTSATPLGIPAQVGNLTVVTTPAAAGSLSLVWTPPTSWGAGAVAGSYVIYRGSTSGAETQLAVVPSSNVSFNDTSIGSANALRYYTVVAYSSAGSFGSNSTEASARTADVPAAPTLVSVLPIVGQKMALTWTAPSSSLVVTNYTVYRTAQGGASNTETPISTCTPSGVTLTCTDSGTSGTGKTYRYKVTAWSAAGQSAQSNEVTATTT